MNFTLNIYLVNLPILRTCPNTELSSTLLLLELLFPFEPYGTGFPPTFPIIPELISDESIP
ncbi:hypothetical protein DERP_008253 [Dermatophagoides pteronyssinus]|uniref:Uncharacterized protein n=1 Tax=Dermatophagoides pteronyssinus TaxID=6956 RepID=A0ABQ8J634_DERPT|nr:hypothetical protein DERP_008253 [Dermatophagoides pteronyssinus]